ncbi:MAG TPA: exo-beta-N-acetylmuramidase NamZ domain-containing protein [Micropepsaceae bacterium]|nr:exo-beta-N-acetylmuramidase NamZ domain-containing protein [Micropepsaceae bacterium]
MIGNYGGLARRCCGLLFGVASALTFTTGAWADAGTLIPERFGAVPEIVQREIAAGHIPGAVIIVGGSGGVIYRQAFGDRIVAPQHEQLAPDAIFDLASLTKVVATTTAIMQLAEAGKLSLDAHVTRYWPAFGANGKDAITISQLLTHTSGLRPDLDLRTQWQGRGAALARIVEERPVSSPGAEFRYSDINFIVLGELVRRVSGKPLDVYSKEKIFRPLRMTDTGFKPNHNAARIVPTDRQDGMLRWGEVQDPTAYRMGGVAGHAGLFSTADDLSRFAEMMLGGGSRAGAHILSPASVRLMTSPVDLPGGIKRGLGWDVASDYDAGMAMAFGPASYGHTGYTGTSLWIEPETKTYLIVLTSRLYPDDRGDVKYLRQDVAVAVADAYRAQKLATGIDVLEEQEFAPLKGLRVGLLTNQTGRDSEGGRTVDVLAHAPDVHLAAIFSPEHGLNGDQNSKVESGTDEATGLPVYSLYGAVRRPTPEMMAGLDAIVVDIQDAGVRFYTYATTIAYVMEEAAKNKIKIVILDRPNPIGAAGIKGPVLDPELESFTGYFPLPVEHGMTLGELAFMFNAEKKIGADLTTIPMRGYRPLSWYDETGLSWINPSPNLRSVKEAILYPAIGLVEGTNVSVGRGTDTPFELVGAPWIDSAKLAAALNKRAIPGVRFEAAEFTPDQDRFAGQRCGGVRIELITRSDLDAPELGLEIASALHGLYPAAFQIAPILGAIGSRSVISALESGQDPKAIAADWATQLRNFEALREKYRLY